MVICCCPLHMWIVTNNMNLSCLHYTQWHEGSTSTSLVWLKVELCRRLCNIGPYSLSPHLLVLCSAAVEPSGSVLQLLGYMIASAFIMLYSTFVLLPSQCRLDIIGSQHSYTLLFAGISTTFSILIEKLKRFTFSLNYKLQKQSSWAKNWILNKAEGRVWPKVFPLCVCDHSKKMQ